MLDRDIIAVDKIVEGTYKEAKDYKG